MKKLMLPLTCLIGSLLAAAVLFATPACAQGFFEDLYPGFLTFQSPPTLTLTGFGGGYVSDKYGTLQEGLQFEQSVTP